MTFERPELLGLAPIAVLLIVVPIISQWRRSLRFVEAYGGVEASRRLTGRSLERFPVLRLSALLAGALLLVVASAGPQPEVEEEVPVTPIDLVIAIDVSLSMTGGDVSPSRIGRARALVERVVEEQVADRIALSLFADWPYGLVPLTHDEEVVSFFAPHVAPEIMAARDQGTSLASSVIQALSMWDERAREDATPLILIVSDGESHGTSEEVLDSISAATLSGVSIWTAGVGTTTGAPLFVGDSDAPILDGAGAPVVAGYDEGLLREMAATGGGVFHDIGTDAGVSGLIADLRRLEGGPTTIDAASYDLPKLLIIVAVLLLLLEALLDRGRGQLPAPTRPGMRSTS